MRLKYDAETGSFYIDLIDRPSAESKEVAEGVVADFDEDGRIVGFDIENASVRFDLSRLETEKLPVNRLRVG